MINNTHIYYESAKKLRLPVTCLDAIHCMYIQLGKKKYFFSENHPPINSGSSHMLTKNRAIFLEMAHKAGFPVPHYRLLSRDTPWHELIEQYVEELQFPLVIKPLRDSHSSEGVLCNIEKFEELILSLEHSFTKYTYMQIEKYHPNMKKYQVLILNQEIISVVQRIAPELRGDGKKNIKELIEHYNAHHATHYSLIAINPQCVDHLALSGQHLEDILPQGKIIHVPYTASYSTRIAHHQPKTSIPQQNITTLLNLAKLTGLGFISLDLLCKDIRLPFMQNTWLILEANSNPSIAHHISPNEGESIDIGKKILMQLILRHPLAYLKHRVHLYLSQSLGNKNGQKR